MLQFFLKKTLTSDIILSLGMGNFSATLPFLINQRKN